MTPSAKTQDERMEIEQTVDEKADREATDDFMHEESSDSDSSSSGSSTTEPEPVKLSPSLIQKVMHDLGPELIKQLQPKLLKAAVPSLCKAFVQNFGDPRRSSAPIRARICFEPLPDYFPSSFTHKKLFADKWMRRWLANEKIFAKLKLKKKGKGRGGTNLPKHFTHAEVLIWPSIWPPESDSLASAKFLTFQAGSRGNKFIRCLPTSVDFHTGFLAKLNEDKASGKISEVHTVDKPPSKQ